MAHDVAPEDVLYHVKAMLMVFANHGNFKNRGKARTRYMPASNYDLTFYAASEI